MTLHPLVTDQDDCPVAALAIVSYEYCEAPSKHHNLRRLELTLTACTRSPPIRRRSRIVLGKGVRSCGCTRCLTASWQRRRKSLGACLFLFVSSDLTSIHVCYSHALPRVVTTALHLWREYLFLLTSAFSSCAKQVSSMIHSIEVWGECAACCVYPGIID